MFSGSAIKRSFWDVLIHKTCLVLRQSHTTEIPWDTETAHVTTEHTNARDVRCKRFSFPCQIVSELCQYCLQVSSNPNLRLGPACRPWRRTLPPVAPRRSEHPEKPACPSACYNTRFFLPWEFWSFFSFASYTLTAYHVPERSRYVC